MVLQVYIICASPISVALHTSFHCVSLCLLMLCSSRKLPSEVPSDLGNGNVTSEILFKRSQQKTVALQKFNLIPRNLLSGIEQSRINYFSALNTLIYLPLPELWTLPGGLKVLHRPQLCWKCTSPVG